MIGAIGSVASQLFQAVRDQRACACDTATYATAQASVAPTGSASQTAPGSGIGADAGKLITDVQSLLLSLQSGGSSTTPGSTGAAATSASTDPAAAVQTDLATLSQDQGKVAGQGHHHHRHHATPGANDASSTVTPGDGTATASASTGVGSLDAVIKAIRAYSASSSAGSTGVGA